jgi:hypothetical protein
MRSFDCWGSQLSKKYRVDRWYPNILGSTIFKWFKSRWCRTAKLLWAFLRFLRNLIIVSWVTTTPGCTANFRGNRCSQPLILRPFGSSGQELPVECQVESFSSILRCLQLKKALERGQDLGIFLDDPQPKRRFYSDSTSTKIRRKSHSKNPTFYVFTPACFETGFGFVLGFEEGRWRNFSGKSKNWRSYRGGKDLCTLDCNNHTSTKFNLFF